jgi:hypothetical protein
MSKSYPYDTEPFDCPFNAQYSEECRYCCSLRVDEDKPDEENDDKEFYEDLHLEQMEQM